MKPSGRSVYVTNLAPILTSLGLEGLVERARAAHLSSLWVRVGRGLHRDPNMALAQLPALRHALDQAGIELWGWHVPFCKTGPAARSEAAAVLAWAEDATLAGIIVDAERTAESPRFQGGPAEAALFSETLAQGLAAAGRSIAFSSHDQPQLHRDLPFAQFLKYIPAACPQIYDRSPDPQARFGRSEAGYRPLLGPDAAHRFQPTGNICIVGDVAYPDVPTCLHAVERFLSLVNARGYTGHSFWCWDEAPDEVWGLLHDIAP